MNGIGRVVDDMGEACVAYERAIDGLVDVRGHKLKYELCNNENENKLNELRNEQNNLE